MFKLADGTNKPLEYEDIVVKSWELFPDEFGLRKYAHKYPDSSDQHKPLYGSLKDKGFVLSGNKKFKLTEKGIARASELDRILKGKIADSGASGRLSRNNEAQLKRICETDAFRLFSLGQKDRILHSDFYTYLGVPRARPGTAVTGLALG